jgi:triosephosphate isomerase
MRKPMVAGNWKMNKTAEQARGLLAEIVPGLQEITAVEKVICPPATALMSVATTLAGTHIGVGAQNMHWENSGAFTGELAPLMVKEFCQYIILGHSERRTYFGETDLSVNKKLKAALVVGLIPIVCIGETLNENESGKTAEVVTRQIREGLKEIKLDQAKQIVIAYEPVWAIGTGRAASGEGANRVLLEFIRPTLRVIFNEEIASSIRILYGGSVTSGNAAEFFSQTEIDGALVGGASLKSGEIIPITRAAIK